MEDVRIAILSRRLAASEDNSVEQQQIQKELAQTFNVNNKKFIQKFFILLFDI
jgi:hypothetical protein